MDLSRALGLDDRELASFVGAGGKKTAIHRLATEATRHDLRVGYTTTTHTPPPEDIPLVIAGPEALPDALIDRDPPKAFASERVENPDRAHEKVRGYDPSIVDSVFTGDVFDWLLVKADGARRREFKAPGPNEPVVPETTTTVVVVASVQAANSRLAAPTVHRPEQVASITGLDVGATLTPDAIGTVLASDDGGLKGVPDGATAVVLLNKADTPALRETARDVVSAAFERTDRFSRGLVSSFETETIEAVEN